MYRYSLLFVAVVISILSLGGNANGELIYTIENYPTFQNGHSLSGTITTTDAAPADGLLDASEIVDWTFAVTGPTNFVGTKGATSQTVVNGEVGISLTQITLPFPPDSTMGNEFSLHHGAPVDDPALQYVLINDLGGVGIFDLYDASSVAGQAWQSFPGSGLGGDPWIIATRAVPEPSAMVLLCSLVSASAIGSVIRRRYRS